jgi:hypothetical protein
MTGSDQESTNKEYQPAPWEKESNSMEDDNKNVSFISGLALLLAVLALVLIGWRGIADSPYEIEYKDKVDGSFAQVKARLGLVEDGLAKQADALNNGKLAWQYYKLEELKAQFGELLVAGSNQYKPDVQALQMQVQALMSKIQGKTKMGVKVVKPKAKADTKVKAKVKPEAKADTKTKAKPETKAKAKVTDDKKKS